MAEPGGGEVQAAGGVVHRRAGGSVEVLLVHRPRYDDWGLPKGKLDPGESHLAAAVREVEEETGMRCAAGEELGTTRYRDGDGRPKVVRYWLMTPVSDAGFEPGDEIDERRWVPVEQARAMLTYQRDADLLATFDSTAAHG